MEFFKDTTDACHIEASLFRTQTASELHFYAKGTKNTSFTDQLAQIKSGICKSLETASFPPESLVFLRLFASDHANQEKEIEALKKDLMDQAGGCAVSIVQQPPLEGGKLVAWGYAVKDEATASPAPAALEGDAYVWPRKGYVHIWHTGLTSLNGNPDSAYQTQTIFSRFGNELSAKGLTIKDHCVRTWLFVKDIDFNYQGVVDARREFFEGINMTKDTHFIASTGIDGRLSSPKTNVIMDAYSVGGICPEQITHLTAPDHLNPTHEYGVTFERGAAVDFGDRRHIYISGTASIDNQGCVVHSGDVCRQADRAMENIGALLRGADAGHGDIAQMIIYLRDVNDAPAVEAFFDTHYGQTPKAIVLAPVCRPGWLIEIECIALKAISKPAYATF